MKFKTHHLTATFLGTIISFFSHAQTTEQPLNTSNGTNSIVPFYKWEIGIDALPLIDKSRDPFGYIVKRNFQKENGRQAVRLKLLPRLTYSNVNGTVSNPSIYIAAGYEWQKLYQRFAVLYGLEPFFRYNQQLIVGQTNNSRSENRQINTGISGFVGGRYYIANHISVTVESHLVYNYQDILITNIGNVSRGEGRSHAIFFNPIHAVYLSYHF